MSDATTKADQLERDFGVLHPRKALLAGLRRRLTYYQEVTPLQASVCDDRMQELHGRGFPGVEAVIVLLMRGGSLAACAKVMGEDVEELAGLTRGFWHGYVRMGASPDRFYAEAQRSLNLLRRA